MFELVIDSKREVDYFLNDMHFVTVLCPTRQIGPPFSRRRLEREREREIERERERDRKGER